MIKHIYVTADSLDIVPSLNINNVSLSSYKYLLLTCNKFGNHDWIFTLNTSTFSPVRYDSIITLNQLMYILDLEKSIGTNATMIVLNSLGVKYNQIDPLIQVKRTFEDETCFRLM